MTVTRSVPTWLRSYLVATIVLFAVSFAAFLVQHALIVSHRLPNTYPYNNPLFQNYSFQFDFDCFVGRFRDFGRPQFFTGHYVPPFTYPAPVALIYEAFFALLGVGDRGRAAHVAFIGTSCLAYFLAALLFQAALRRRGTSPKWATAVVAIALLTSYPITLQLYLANVEGLLWIIVMLGLWAWYRERYYLAAICFGIATSMKLFPFVYFGLLESKKQWRAILLGLATCISVSLISLRLLGPIHESSLGIAAGLTYFQQVYVAHYLWREIGMDHSLFGFLKAGLWHLRAQTNYLPVARLALPIEAAIGLALYPIIRRRPDAQRVTLLVIASIILPTVSHDYTLLYLYAPWAMLMMAGLEKRLSSQQLTAMFACFAILFTAQDWLIWHGVRYAGQFKCVFLVVLSYLSLSKEKVAQERAITSTWR